MPLSLLCVWLLATLKRGTLDSNDQRLCPRDTEIPGPLTEVLGLADGLLPFSPRPLSPCLHSLIPNKGSNAREPQMLGFQNH